MGTACILNARRCGRTHCRYTGPYYLAMIARYSSWLRVWSLLICMDGSPWERLFSAEAKSFGGPLSWRGANFPRRRTRLLMAPTRRTAVSTNHLFIEAKRTHCNVFGTTESDPNVASDPAVQEVFADPYRCGLASMYPALYPGSDWRVSCSEPSWISARLRSD